jgi:murein DD-endopeptidase MepM/ murein hydrolase activator NlpD
MSKTIHQTQTSSSYGEMVRFNKLRDEGRKLYDELIALYRENAKAAKPQTLPYPSACEYWGDASSGANKPVSVTRGYNNGNTANMTITWEDYLNSRADEAERRAREEECKRQDQFKDEYMGYYRQLIEITNQLNYMQNNVPNASDNSTFKQKREEGLTILGKLKDKYAENLTKNHPPLNLPPPPRFEFPDYVLPPITPWSMRWPILGITESNITSEQQKNRLNPVLNVRRDHNGIDIAVAVGTPVYAPADGTIYKIGYGSEPGNYIIINHADGFKTVYMHLSVNNIVAVNSIVLQGTLIGLSGNTGGSTGPHLHYEVWNNGVVQNPREWSVPLPR